jgi:hypothetical protein
MSDNTLNKALRTWATILAPAATTARTASARPRRPFSTKRALRRRCSGSPTRPRRGEKGAGGATRWCGASLARATRTRSAASITVRRLLGRTRAFNAALVRASTAYATVRPPSRCADRRPSLLSFRPSAAKRDIHPRFRGRSWSCLPSCRP